MLADGETIPSPGQSVVVKLLNDDTPNGDGHRWPSSARPGSRHRRRRTPGPASSSASTTASTRPASPLVDPGAYSQIRILGIPGNQTTGQQRVPVIMTSLRDGTVGTTARGVKMYNIFNSYPTQSTSSQVRRPDR